MIPTKYPTPNSEVCPFCNLTTAEVDRLKLICPDAFHTGQASVTSTAERGEKLYIVNGADDVQFYGGTSVKIEFDEVSLCPGCGCATHTNSAGFCGKCSANKSGQAPMPGSEHVHKFIPCDEWSSTCVCGATK